MKGKLIGLKAKYVERHGLAAAIEGAGFEEFSVDLDLWRESRLPSYKEKISEAKTKALQQLAEDIVFRLRENLILVRRQIDDLNKALKDVPFGSEQYQFTVEIDPAHRDFHNLVMDAGRFEKESLFGASALAAPELKETLETFWIDLSKPRQGRSRLNSKRKPTTGSTSTTTSKSCTPMGGTRSTTRSPVTSPAARHRRPTTSPFSLPCIAFTEAARWTVVRPAALCFSMKPSERWMSLESPRR